jgi:hypothetical protein
MAERNSGMVERLARVEKRIEEQGKAEEEAFRTITTSLGTIVERLALIEGSITACPVGPAKTPRRKR